MVIHNSYICTHLWKGHISVCRHNHRERFLSTTFIQLYSRCMEFVITNGDNFTFLRWLGCDVFNFCWVALKRVCTIPLHRASFVVTSYVSLSVLIRAWTPR